MDESRLRSEEAVRIGQAIGDKEVEALGLVGLSRVALRSGDYERVKSLASQALALTEKLDPPARVWPLHLLAAGTRLAGQYDAAAELYRKSLDLNRSLHNKGLVATELHNLGHVQIHRGDLAEAERCFQERVPLVNESEPYDRAMLQLNRAALACFRKDLGPARQFINQTKSTLEAAGIVLDPDDAFEVSWLEEQLAKS
jgi:tetratricopeptide (TPR) repeat protein